MGFRYFFQFMAMLIAPIITYAAIYTICSTNNLLVTAVIIFFYYLQLDMWDPWKPQVARQFLANAKKIGW